MPRKQKYFVVREPIPRKIYFVLSIGAIVLALTLYAVITEKRIVSPIFLPSLGKVVSSIAQMHSEKILFPSLYISALRVYSGLLLIIITSIPLGILMGSYKAIEAIFNPIVGFIRYLPILGLIPLFIIWFGIGDAEKIAVIVFGGFFQLVIMASDNVASVKKELLEVSYTLGITPRKALRKVLIPAALPAILDDIRIIAGWVWTYVVVAELVAARRGLGYIIIQSMRGMKTDRIIACILIIGGLGLVTDALFGLAHKWLFPWSEKMEK